MLWYVPGVYECKNLRLKRPNLSRIKTLKSKSSQEWDFLEIKGDISPNIATCKGLRATVVTLLVEFAKEEKIQDEDLRERMTSMGAARMNG